MFPLKKYRRVMSHDTEEEYKIWRKTALLFQKWQELSVFRTEYSKVSEILTLIGSYCAKHVTFDLKSTKELSIMTLKSDAKFEEKLSCGLENDMTNFLQSNEKSQNWGFQANNLYGSYDKEEWCKILKGIYLSFQNWHEEFENFWPKHSKVSKTCILMVSFWPKHIMFELKKYRAVMFDGTEDWSKIWRKTDLCFQKMTWAIWQTFTGWKIKISF